MASRHTIDQQFISQEVGGRTITPRIMGGAITPANSESVMIPIKVNSQGEQVMGFADDPLLVTAPAYSTALTSGSVVKSSPGFLSSLTGYNSGAAQFVQIHNLSTAPLNGAIPISVIAVAATSNFSITFGSTGLPLTDGIGVFNSSTAATLTSGSNDILFTAIYN